MTAIRDMFSKNLRQSGIDEELFDVISGFEALVGGPCGSRDTVPARAAL